MEGGVEGWGGRGCGGGGFVKLRKPSISVVN